MIWDRCNHCLRQLNGRSLRSSPGTGQSGMSQNATLRSGIGARSRSVLAIRQPSDTSKVIICPAGVVIQGKRPIKNLTDLIGKCFYSAAHVQCMRTNRMGQAVSLPWDLRVPLARWRLP